MIVLDFAAGAVGGVLVLVYLGTAYERAARRTGTAVTYVRRTVEPVGGSIHARDIAHVRWRQALRATDEAMRSPFGLAPCRPMPAARLERLQEGPHALAYVPRASTAPGPP